MRNWIFTLLLITSTTTLAVPAAVKHAIDRQETPNQTAESLVMPFAFSTETMGLNLGVGVMANGYYQEQMTVGATAFGGDISQGIGIGLWNYQVPGSDRLYFSLYGMVGYYPDQRAYGNPVKEFHPLPMPGDNDSSPKDYIQANGSSNWWEMKLEYSLPIGATADQAVIHYQTRNGQLISKPSGGDSWNPLESGATVLLLRQFNRYQTFEEADRTLNGALHALELGLLYDNTDFPVNPSIGSKQYFSISYDPAWLESDHQWSFMQFEASKYFSLGESNSAYQRVVALNVWTGYSPSWNLEYNDSGEVRTNDAAPYNEGSTLGGFYRLRGYDQNRFHGKASLYIAAEYRHTLKYNPIANVRWLKFLKLDWFQLVGFFEAGRVASKYSANELLTDLKTDYGVSVRTMLASLVLRADIATSEESTNFWFMVDHPF